MVLELRTGDRTGLLHTVGQVLEDHGARLCWARVTTLGASVVDVFALDLGAGDSPQRRAELEAAVLGPVRLSPGTSGGSA